VLLLRDLRGVKTMVTTACRHGGGGHSPPYRYHGRARLPPSLLIITNWLRRDQAQ
jgi:hypothetical protein